MPSQREQLLEAEVKSHGDFVYQYFLDLVAEGNSVVFAHMLVFQQAPMMKGSDRSFNESMREKMSGMFEKNRDLAVTTARKAGINTTGKYYVGGLGRYNDPAAWVSTVDDVKDVCKARNLNSTGLVEHKAREVAPQKRTPLAKDIVDRFVAKELTDPKTLESVRAGKTKIQDLREKVVDRHASKRR